MARCGNNHQGGARTPEGKAVTDSNLYPGVGAAKPGEQRKPHWEGLTQEQWDGLLGRIAEGENASRIVRAEFDVCYDTFTAWRNRVGLDDEFHAAILARVEAMQFEIMDIADDQEADIIQNEDGTEYTNHNVIQRAKLRIDTRWRVMQSLDARFKPKQDINVSSLSDDDLRKALAAEVKGFIGGSTEEGD